MIEDASYYPLFSTSDLPIDFSAAGLVPDSPGKLQQFINARRTSFALSNSQAVPASNINLQNYCALDDQPLFSLFMHGPEKMDLNGGYVKGFQIPEELLLQSSSMVPDFRNNGPKFEHNSSLMGMDQSVQMGIMPEPMVNGDFNMVPQLPSPDQAKQVPEEGAKGSKKRKHAQAIKTEQMSGLPVPEGQLSPEEERIMKRQRRLVKNREAAQLFRQRQKAYIQDLEKKVADLSSTNNDYRAKVELLNSENKLIKEQLSYLRNFITQAVSFSFPKSPGSEDSPSGSPGMLSLPAGITFPPEILGSLPGLMGIPGLPLPPILIDDVVYFAEAFAQLTHPSSPQDSPDSSPAQPHMEAHSIKIAGNNHAMSPSGNSALIPPPTVKLSSSNNGTNAVVPQFNPPASPQQMMVPDGADHIRIKYEFDYDQYDAQGNMIKQK